MRSLIVCLLLCLVGLAACSHETTDFFLRYVNAAAFSSVSVQYSNMTNMPPITVDMNTATDYMKLEFEMFSHGVDSVITAAGFTTNQGMDSFMPELGAYYTVLITGVTESSGANSSAPVWKIKHMLDDAVPPTSNYDATVTFVGASYAVSDQAHQDLFISAQLKDSTNVYSSPYSLSVGNTWSVQLSNGTYDLILRQCNTTHCVADETTLKLTALHAYSVYVVGNVEQLSLVVSDDEKFKPMINFRVGHFSHVLGHGPIDVYLNGKDDDFATPTFRSLGFGAVSPYVLVFEEALDVQVFPAGTMANTTKSTLTERPDFTAPTALAFTMLFADNTKKNQTTSELYGDDLTPPSARYFRVRAFNMIDTPSAVDVNVTLKNVVSQMFDKLEYTDVSTYATLPAGQAPYNTYTITAGLQSSGNVNASTVYTLSEVSVFSVFYYGNNELMVVADVQYAPPSPVTLIRVVHGLVGSAAPSSVMLEVDQKTVIKKLSYGHVSNYEAVDSGASSILLKTNATNVVASMSLNATAYSNYTLLVYGNTDAPNATDNMQVTTMLDDLTQISEMARIRLVHLNQDMTPYSLIVTSKKDDNVTVTMSDVKYGEMSSYLVVPAGSYSITVRQGQNAALDKTMSASLKQWGVYSVFTFGAAPSAAPSASAYTVPAYRVELIRDYPLPSSGNNHGLTTLELVLIIGCSVLLAMVVLAVIILAVRRRPEQEEGYTQLPDN